MNYLYLGLLFLAVTVVETLAGGANLLFNLPSCGILAILAIVSVLSFRRLPPPPNSFCLAGTAVFFGYVLGRILLPRVSGVDGTTVEYWTRPDLFSVLGALIVYLVLMCYLTSAKDRRWLIVALLTLGLINVGFGAVQYFRHSTKPLLPFLPAWDYGARATGFYGCPDHLAGFLEVVGLLGLSIGCWGRWKSARKVFVLYASLMCLAGVILTGSRGGLLSAAAGFFVFLVLSLLTIRKGMVARKWLVVGCTVLAAALIIGGVAYFMSGQMNLKLRWMNVKLHGEDRLDMWRAAVEQFKLNPVFGTGSGSYLYMQRHFRTAREWLDAIYAHNDYLQLLAEFGLVGFATFLFFLGTHIGNGVKAFRWFVGERLGSLGRVRSDTLALNIGALSGLTTYVIHSAFDFNLHIPANALVMAMVVAILANPGVEMPAPAPQGEWIGRLPRLALPVLGVWLGWAGLPTLPAEYFSRQAREAERREQHEDAIKLALQGITYDKKNPDLYLYLGDGLLGVAQDPTNNPVRAEMSFKAAVTAYTNGLALFPHERYLLLGAGWSLDGLKRFDEAEPYFKQLVADEPNSAQLSGYYAAHLHAAGKLDEAEAEYNRSIKLYWSPFAADGLKRLTQERAAAGAGPPKQ